VTPGMTILSTDQLLAVTGGNAGIAFFAIRPFIRPNVAPVQPALPIPGAPPKPPTPQSIR